MSVVAVKIDKNKITFAADSIAVYGYTKVTDKFTKLEEINEMIIGGVGTAEEASLLFMFAQTHKPLSADEKSVTEFFLEFYKWKNSLSLPFSSSNSYLFGVCGKCFYIDNMLVKEIRDYYAIGAGMDYALAVLWLGHTAQEAVRAACQLSCFVAEPIIIKEMKTMEMRL